MNSLYNQALKQSNALRKDLDTFQEQISSPTSSSASSPTPPTVSSSTALQGTHPAEHCPFINIRPNSSWTHELFTNNRRLRQYGKTRNHSCKARKSIPVPPKLRVFRADVADESKISEQNYCPFAPNSIP